MKLYIDQTATEDFSCEENMQLGFAATSLATAKCNALNSLDPDYAEQVEWDYGVDHAGRMFWHAQVEETHVRITEIEIA